MRRPAIQKPRRPDKYESTSECLEGTLLSTISFSNHLETRYSSSRSLRHSAELQSDELADLGFKSTLRLKEEVRKKLQSASVFGEHLATAIAQFAKEVDDWRTSIACLHDTDELSPLGANASLSCHTASQSVPCHSPNEMQYSSEVVSLHHSPHFGLPQASPSHAPLSSPKYGGKAGNDGTFSSATFAPHSSQKLMVLAAPSTPAVAIASSGKQAPQGQNPQLRVLWTAEGEVARTLPSAHRLENLRSKSAEAALHQRVSSGNINSSILDRFVIHPLSPQRYVLDIISILMVIYDIVVFPLAAFNFDASTTAYVMRLVTTIYWSLDFIFSFWSGYQVDGNWELRFRFTCKRYLKGLAAVDGSIICIDWTLFLIEASKAWSSIARLSKATRMVRIMRLIRMVRTARMIDMIEHLKTLPVSGPIFSILNITRLIGNLMIVNHFFACGWYAIGQHRSNAVTWIEKYLTPDDSEVERYLISYHWTVAQFTPCPHPIHAVTFHERLYNVSLIFFGLVIYASLLGNVTAIINATRKSHYDAMAARHNLNEFLRGNKVTFSLSTRIHEFIKMNRIRKTRVLESDVLWLSTLSSSLRMELHYEVHGPVLTRHPLFIIVDSQYNDTLVHVCHTAAKLLTLANGDEIFHYRNKAENFLMPLSGRLLYTPGRMEYSEKDNSGKVAIDDGGWLCEFPLWITWENCGRLEVYAQTDIVMVDANKFEKAASVHASSLPTFKQYAVLFTKSLVEDAHSFFIDDLWGSRYELESSRLNTVLQDSLVLDDILKKSGSEQSDWRSSKALRETPTQNQPATRWTC